MKKSSFVAMIMGTIGGVLASLGMVFTLQPEMGAGNWGIYMGIAGLVVLLATVLIKRKMDGKPAIHFTGKNILAFFLAIIGALGLGLGMTMAMVWGNMIPGILIGLVGIVMLLSLIPLFKGIKN